MRKGKRNVEHEFSILTLDDDEIMTSTLAAYFQRSGYAVDTENDPYQGIERVKTGKYDILLLDFLMTPINGKQVVEEIRKFNKDLFIILLTGHKSMAPPIQSMRELDIQGYYEKSDRFDQLELLVESCAKSIKQMREIKTYQSKLSDAYESMEKGYIEMIQTLRFMVEKRDVETKGHSDRVAVLSAAIAEYLGQDRFFVDRIRIAGMFHDIGKIGVPDCILLKNGRLTDEEYAEIKRHPAASADILLGLSNMQDLVPVVRAHHEYYNGKGYPDGLKEEEIPFASRIIAVADSFDAMISKRAYRDGMPIEKAKAEIERCKGTQFDPKIADAFLTMIDEYGDDKFLETFAMKGE